MRKLINVFSILLFIVTLAACYRIDIQQGNMINYQQVQSLKTGMTTKQVTRLLGAPVLTNLFSDDELIYVYTFSHRFNKMQSKRLIIYFHRGRLSRYTYDSQPPQAIIPEPKRT